MFGFCSNVKFIDISSFKDAKIYDNIFYEIADYGTIKVHENFINKIKNIIPYSWEIILNNYNNKLYLS